MDMFLSGSVKKRFFADKHPLQGKVQGELDPREVNASFIFIPVTDVPGVDQFYINHTVLSTVLLPFCTSLPAPKNIEASDETHGSRQRRIKRYKQYFIFSSLTYGPVFPSALRMQGSRSF